MADAEDCKCEDVRDTTDAEEWDEYAQNRWPWMPAWLRGLLFVLGCEQKDG